MYNTDSNTPNNTYLNHPKIANFIETIIHQIHTENEALGVVEELKDHIECLVEDYIDRNYDLEEAIDKALLQMGDPTMIGYSFTNPDVMKKRNFNMHLFQSIGIGLIVLSFIWMFVFAGNTGEFYLNLEMLVYLNFNFITIFFIVKTQYSSIKIKHYQMDFTPLLIIWPTKHTFDKKEIGFWAFIGFMFAPILLLFPLAFFSGFFEAYPLEIALLITAQIIIAACMFLYGEKFRIPKTILAKEGLIHRGKFTPWVSITQKRWINSASSINTYKTLQINAPNNLNAIGKFKISQHQFSAVQKILSHIQITDYIDDKDDSEIQFSRKYNKEDLLALLRKQYMLLTMIFIFDGLIFSPNRWVKQQYTLALILSIVIFMLCVTLFRSSYKKFKKLLPDDNNFFYVPYYGFTNPWVLFSIIYFFIGPASSTNLSHFSNKYGYNLTMTYVILSLLIYGLTLFYLRTTILSRLIITEDSFICPGKCIPFSEIHQHQTIKMHNGKYEFNFNYNKVPWKIKLTSTQYRFIKEKLSQY